MKAYDLMGGISIPLFKRDNKLHLLMRQANNKWYYSLYKSTDLDPDPREFIRDEIRGERDINSLTQDAKRTAIKVFFKGPTTDYS